MKKILIVYSPISQTHLVKRLIREMTQKGNEIEAFNSNNWMFLDEYKDIPHIYRFLRFFLSYKWFGVIVQKFFLKNLLLKLSANYDYIDIHYMAKEYIDFLLLLSKPYKVTIWGSDFYRMKETEIEGKRECLKKASLIQVETEHVKNDLVKFEPSYLDKIRVCNFGIDIIDDIDRVEQKDRHIKCYDKIIVTCGYNGSEGQQHLIMIEALQKLPEEIKGKIMVYYPMTYGLDTSYRLKVIEALSKVNYDFKIFENRLSDEELALLRLDTDVALNIQITDSLSSSLMQHLYAGNVVVVGDWLPYEFLYEKGIYYKTTSIENITKTIESILVNLHFYKDLSSGNKNIVRSVSAWSEVANRQNEIYKELQKN